MSSRSAFGADASALGVCFGGPSPEHDVSILTGLQACRELVRQGRAVVGLYWSKTGEWYQVDPSLEAGSFVDGVPRGAEALRLATGPEGGFALARATRGLISGAKQKTLEIDVVVNCCHGGPGEDGSLQATFDLAGVRYTGPSAQGAALGMDKLAFSAVASIAGLSVLPRVLLDESSSEEQLDFPGPYIVKPRFGGSSIGVEVVADLKAALACLNASVHLRNGAVVEPYREDLFDLNVAVRTWPEPQLSAIEKPERSTAGAEILGYADKYTGGEGMASAPRELPAQIPEELADRLRETALFTSRPMGTRGVARVDFLSDGSKELWLNEVNTIPGSLARYLWVDPPVPFGELLADMVEEAIRVPAARPNATGADGTVLRTAGSIAGKLG